MVPADKKLTAFVELEAAIRGGASLINHVMEPRGKRQGPTMKFRLCLTRKNLDICCAGL